MEKRAYIFVLILICCTLQTNAGITNWTGFGSGILGGTDVNNWYNASNWSNGVPGAGDDVQIGVTGFYYNPPILNASTTINSLTFGVTTATIALTINTNVTLTVTNNIAAKYNSGNTTINIIGQTTGGVLGGTINCGGSFLVGDVTAPPTPALFGYFNTAFTTTINLAIQSFSVAGNLTLNTTSSTGNVLGTIYSNVNNPTLNINNGRLSVTGNIQETNSNYVNTSTTATNKAQLVVNASGSGTNVLNFGGALSIATGGVVDFYGPGTGSSTINYTGTTAQTVASALTGIDASPATYQHLGFSGAGVKTMDAGSFSLSGNWSSAGGRVDAATNLSSITFSGTTQSISDGGAGVTFGNVTFRGSGTKTISSGKFSVAGTGVLTMGGTATLATGGNLTLLSATSGTASVAPVPSNTSITGNVNVQRLIKGSPTDLSKRGYRFISSAVYTATVNGIKCFDLKYLLDSAYVSGMSGGGFNAPSTNPSLYLYREDFVATTTGFTATNYKGIAKINNTNAYDIGIQKRLTTSNIADTTTRLPIGNGVLFFFRGNKSDNATQSGSKVVLPFDYPEDVAFTQVGILNTGTVNVKPWYNFDNSSNPDNYLAYTNSPSLNNSATRGFILVGNPYASTINWEKFNRNGANSSIYGQGMPAASVTQGKIWIYNPTSKQYDTYIQAPTVSSVTDTTTTVNPTGSIATGDASNMIASGQGFFIRATAAGQKFSFRESAKTSTQPTSSNLIRLMNVPATLNAMTYSTPADDAPATIIPMLSFRLIKDSINTDDVVLAFNDSTPGTFTAVDDAEDLNGNGALVSLSIISTDNIAAAIKRLKLPQTDKQVIKLLADATTSGQYQLKLKKIENLPSAYDVWLKDAFTHDSLDIKNNNTYAFNIDKSNSASFGVNRFTVVISRNQALAMHPLSFKAEKTPQGVNVIWKTENEAADYNFVIERSTDGGKTFKQLGKLRSTNSGLYNYLDSQPIIGQNQYRVRIENILDNKASYTSIARLNYTDVVISNATSTASKISVYPNPATTTVNIKMDTDETNGGSYSVKISNSSGLVIKELNTSQTSVQENISGLLPGTYLVKVIDIKANKIQGETKFIKLN